MAECTSETDDKLADVAKDMPKNAKYTYRDIKNRLIETHKSQKGQEKVYEHWFWSITYSEICGTSH